MSIVEDNFDEEEDLDDDDPDEVAFEEDLVFA
jgi:hypothetical protein